MSRLNIEDHVSDVGHDQIGTTTRAPRGLSVSQVHAALDGALAAAGLDRLWITGTVTGLRRKGRFTGFELVEYEADATTIRAVLPMALFSRAGAVVTATLRRAGVELQDGLEMAFLGALETNGAYGPLRFVVEAVDPRVAVGAATLARDALLADLRDSGALDAQRHLPITAVPQRLGLIASPGTAGRADVITLLQASPHPFHVMEVPAAVSGPAAAVDVPRAIARLSQEHLDVLLVVRGGGARSDLAAWDSAEVAYAIADCPVPVWIAVGHASDQTVADVVAHTSFPTPSAAVAELVARAEMATAQAAFEQASAERAHEVASARRRTRVALVVAVVAVILVVLLLAAR